MAQECGRIGNVLQNIGKYNDIKEWTVIKIVVGQGSTGHVDPARLCNFCADNIGFNPTDLTILPLVTTSVNEPVPQPTSRMRTRSGKKDRNIPAASSGSAQE
jgi:hypothetical protein